MAIDVAKYKKMKSRDISDFENISIKAYIPEPTDSDYKRGYIKRYFVQKVNDINANIFEVSEFSYDSISNNPFYKTAFLNWRLTGTMEEIKESNFKSIKFYSKDMKKLIMYLPNYLQFAKLS